MPKAVDDTALRCLDLVAIEAGGRTDLTITRLPPRDTALGWKSAAIHPMQLLETDYQGMVLDAARGIDGLQARQTAINTALGTVFLFDAGEARLLGVDAERAYDGVALPLAEDRVSAARRLIATLRTDLQPPPGQQVDGTPVRAMLGEAIALARSVLAPFQDAYRRIVQGAAQPLAPMATLDALAQEIDRLAVQAQTAVRVDALEQVVDKLADAIDTLEGALAGLASVQMSYLIDSFYLFRLLIRYRVESDRALSPEIVAEASGALTKLIANNHPWLSGWLRDRIVALDARIAAVDPAGDTLFFLKGGRAVHYLMGTPQLGENDWDTQIVINPDLPAARWYALFLRVSNAVLLALKDFKVEFYALLHGYAAQFEREIPGPMEIDDPGPAALFDAVFDGMEIDDPVDWMEIDEPPEPGPADRRANGKAELIDVGLPRYDTVEARAQWQRLRGGIARAPDGMAYPGVGYYIDEYVTMIAELFVDPDANAAKAPKRIKRLYEILGLPAAGAVAIALRPALAPLLPQACALVDTAADQPLRTLLTVLLHDAVDAADMTADRGLAGAFDALFVAQAPEIDRPDLLPARLSAAIAAEGAGWNPLATTIASAIGLFERLAAQIAAHRRSRAAWVAAQAALVDRFVRTICGGGGFLPDEELTVQIAVRGSFAAHRHAAYARSDQTAALDPAMVLSLGLYAADAAADPATLIELVQPLVDDFVATCPALSIDPAPPAGVIRLFWTDPQTLGTIAYQPLAIEIVVAPTPDIPLLAYLWGWPVLGLRDLIREYQQEAARIEQFNRRRGLLATITALKAILVRPVDPLAVGPTPLALAANRCSHLLIASTDLARAQGFDYPRDYWPDAAFRVPLTANRPALARALTIAGPARPRTIALLAVNGGHGDIGGFAGWNAADLTTYLVGPLLAAGVRADCIVLDFCVSASLIGVFAPLCSPGGVIVASLYSITQVIVTTGFWSQVHQPLATGNRVALGQAVSAAARTIARGLTGLVHMRTITGDSEAAILIRLAAHPADRDAISIVRNLPAVAAALGNRQATLADVHRALMAVQARPSLGFYEQLMLVDVPGPAAAFTDLTRAAVEAKFGQRLVDILTGANYGLQIDVAGLPLFGDPGLWSLLLDRREAILGLAAGLERCPTPLALYRATDRALVLDQALAPLGQPQPPPALMAMLREVEPGAPEDVTTILADLFADQTIVTLDQRADPV